MAWWVLGSGLALAGPWEPREVRGFSAEGPAVDLAIAPFAEGPGLVVGRADGLTVYGPDLAARATLELPVAALRRADLDGDGVEELLVCGPTGLHALPTTLAALPDPIALSAEPCAALAAFTPPPRPGLPAFTGLLTWTGQQALRWQAGPAGLVAEPIPLPEGFGAPALEGSGAGWALLGRSLLRGQAEGPTAHDLPGPAVGLAPDGAGFALALGGEDPALLRADGDRIPLPGTPRWVQAAPLNGEPSLLLGLAPAPPADPPADAEPAGAEDPPLALPAGALPPVPPPTVMVWRADTLDALTTSLPAERAAVGDLTGDGCADLALAAGDRVELLVGSCEAAPPAEPAQALAQVPPAPAPVARPEPPPAGPRAFTVRECTAMAGLAGGLSYNPGQSWSSVGLPEIVPAVSPAVALGCALGTQGVRLRFGLDSAPTFFYLARHGRMNHALAVTAGLELRAGALRAGPVVSGGLLLWAVGARLAVLPFEARDGRQHGFELRAMTYPLNPSVQGMVGYTWQFSARRTMASAR